MLGFDLIELSTGFISLPPNDLDVRWLIAQARRCLEAGADRIMIESEGITEASTPGERSRSRPANE